MEAVTLSFELFAICVKVYKLLEDASDMPNSARYLRVRLCMERDKLIDWGVLAGVSEDESSLSPGLSLNKHLVNDALLEIKQVLFELTKLGQKHDLEPADIRKIEVEDEDDAGSGLKPSSSALRKRALVFIEKTRKFPGKIKWAAFDREEFETLLSKLGKLNEHMMFFFERHQREMHYRMQQDSYMSILQANNKLDDLFALMSSLTVVATAAAADNKSSSAEASADVASHTKRLVSLTRFKALNLAIENERSGRDSGGDTDQQAVAANLGDAASSRDAMLWSDDLVDMVDEAGSEDPEKPARSSARYEDASVWVEWRYYEPVGEDEDPPPFIEDRISRLATLLRDGKKPEEFRLPPCRGYVHEPDLNRYGFVFGFDTDAVVANKETRLECISLSPPVRLSDLLSSARKPSLNKRVQIARSVASSIWFLHATNWLHKGLRSESVVLLSSSTAGPSGKYNILASSTPPRPFLAGFDYSRPASPGEVTERPAENRLHDLYRHPMTQFDFPRDGKRGFRKIYDIYSLGVVLFEIGVWSPVHEFLGLKLDTEKGPRGRLRSADVKGVREKLLSIESVGRLEADAGESYANAVQACLRGEFGGGGSVAEESEGRDGGDDGAQLQLDFGERVIHRLDSISV